jgi:hypothetical protein
MADPSEVKSLDFATPGQFQGRQKPWILKVRRGHGEQVWGHTPGMEVSGEKELLKCKRRKWLRT